MRRPTKRLLALAAVAAVLTAGCSSPFGRGDRVEEVFDTPRPELSEPAAPLDSHGGSEQAPPSTEVGITSTSIRRSDTAAPTTSAASDAPQHRELAESTDPTGDAGLQAPGFADLVRVRVSSDDHPRFTIDLGAEVPAQLDTGEVMGLGVDLYRSGGTESDYQLFADGGSDGWRAYLQTPEGFVQYPGSFRMGGTTIEFEVPWSSIGGEPPLEVSVFLDWSKERVALNASSSDRLPDRGRITVPAG